MRHECVCKDYCNTLFLFRLVIVAICVSLSVYQLWECFRKFIHPPLYTYQSIVINDTLMYPALTVCRSPAYKTNNFQKYGLTSTEISYSSVWKNFNFENYTLSQFFEETTYNLSEYMAIYALDSYRSNVNVRSQFTISGGKCFTFTPLYYSSYWGSSMGYFFYLRHTDKTSTMHSTDFSGYNFYIHTVDSIFTEKAGGYGNLIEKLQINVGDAVQYKLQAMYIDRLESGSVACISDKDYNPLKCKEECVNQAITEDIGCSTPWLPNPNLPECNTSEQTQLAIDYSAAGSIYLRNYIRSCGCEESCTTAYFSAYLQGEKSNVYDFDSSVSIYYPSNMIISVTEEYSYDGNQFLSDLGGSLGFLLGLSVLGAISWLENVLLRFALWRRQKNMEKKSLNNETSLDGSRTGHSSTKLENHQKSDNVDDKQEYENEHKRTSGIKSVNERNEGHFLSTKNIMTEFQIGYTFFSKKSDSKDNLMPK